MTAAEWGVLIGVIGVPLASALIAIGIAVGKRGSEPGIPRETALPPAPQRAGSLLDGDLAALRGRVTALEAGELRAQEKREEMASTLIRIETKLEERTERAGRRKEHRAERPSE